MKKAFRACPDHTKMTVLLGKNKKKKTPEKLVTSHEVAQDPDDMEKGNKLGSSIEGSKNTTVCVSPYP